MSANEAAGLLGARVATSELAATFLRRVPALLRSGSITTVTEAETCYNEVRGPIQWSETLSARAASGSGALVFVCTSTRRGYDTPANRCAQGSAGHPPGLRRSGGSDHSPGVVARPPEPDPAGTFAGDPVQLPPGAAGRVRQAHELSRPAKGLGLTAHQLGGGVARADPFRHRSAARRRRSPGWSMRRPRPATACSSPSSPGWPVMGEDVLPVSVREGAVVAGPATYRHHRGRHSGRPGGPHAASCSPRARSPRRDELVAVLQRSRGSPACAR